MQMGFEFWSTSFEAPYPSNMDLNIELWVRYYSHQCHLLRKKWFVLFFHRLPNLILGVPPFLRASPTPHVPSAAHLLPRQAPPLSIALLPWRLARGGPARRAWGVTRRVSIALWLRHREAGVVHGTSRADGGIKLLILARRG